MMVDCCISPWKKFNQHQFEKSPAFSSSEYVVSMMSIIEPLGA